MDIIDEMEYERLEPVCFYCGRKLTKDEWEDLGDICQTCYDNSWSEDLAYNDEYEE